MEWHIIMWLLMNNVTSGLCIKLPIICIHSGTSYTISTHSDKRHFTWWKDAYELKIRNRCLNVLNRGNISSRFPRNFEAFASEFLGNLEEIFPRYWVMDKWLHRRFHNNHPFRVVAFSCCLVNMIYICHTFSIQWSHFVLFTS